MSKDSLNDIIKKIDKKSSDNNNPPPKKTITPSYRTRTVLGNRSPSNGMRTEYFSEQKERNKSSDND